MATNDPWAEPTEEDTEKYPDFLEVMHLMFEIQKMFPDVEWNTSEGMVSHIPDGRLHIHLNVGRDNAKLFNDAREMFRDT